MEIMFVDFKHFLKVRKQSYNIWFKQETYVALKITFFFKELFNNTMSRLYLGTYIFIKAIFAIINFCYNPIIFGPIIFNCPYLYIFNIIFLLYTY